VRKTKRCIGTALQRMGGRLVMRTCDRGRDCDGRHRDQYGNWTAEVKADG
jgi:hypothetical protein